MRIRRAQILVTPLKIAAVSGAAILVASSAVLAAQQSQDDTTSSYPARVDSLTAEAELSYLGPERSILFPEREPEFTAPESELARYGSYRLVPSGFVGELPFEQIPLEWEVGIATSDPEVLKASPLYLNPPAAIPPALRLAVLDSHDASSGVNVRQVFKSDDGQQSVEITRRAVLRSPIDVLLPEENASMDLRTEMLEGGPGIVLRRSSSSPNPHPFTFIQTTSGDIETIVIVRGLPESVAFEILNGLR